MHAGNQAFDLASNSLLYNFTYERSYIGKANYDAAVNEDAEFAEMLEAVKNEYNGLSLSVFGDSISTYHNISNNTSYNPTIAENALWYTEGAISEACLYDHTYTYWGSMLRELGMELCVNNSWSGDSLGSERFKTRAKQLHNNAGKSPDVIVVYFGINDCWGAGRNVGDLLTLLENKGNKKTDDVVGEWYESVLAKNGNCSNWDELYATLLSILMEEYPGAKIVCVGLAHNGAKADYPSADKWVPLYNESIRAISDYMGFTYVEQSNVITNENCHAYMHDTRYLHPNAYGHRLIFEEIIRTLYKEIA
jgi:lysophospholipase L1-like esterase